MTRRTNKVSKDYERKHLQSRLNCLWKLYGAWEQLLKEPGAEREDGTDNVVASGEWWTQKIKENKAYKEFRLGGLKLEEQIKAVFEGSTAEAVEAESPPKHLFSPNSKQPLRQQEHLDPPSEGLGDSENDAFRDEPLNSTGLTDPIGGIGLKSIIPSAGNLESGSRGKRKSEGSVERRRNKKALADALSVYRESPSVTFEQKDTSIDDALKVLDGFDEFRNDEDLRNRCYNILENSTTRKILISFNKYEDAKYLLGWLKHNINSLP
ncbi:hypothetical protein K1719_004232 [Acacia pycnantha]|nr:hypothetical protein K1719_004232 [Acacia pycnantha]